MLTQVSKSPRLTTLVRVGSECAALPPLATARAGGMVLPCIRLVVLGMLMLCIGCTRQSDPVTAPHSVDGSSAVPSSASPAVDAPMPASAPTRSTAPADRDSASDAPVEPDASAAAADAAVAATPAADMPAQDAAAEPAEEPREAPPEPRSPEPASEPAAMPDWPEDCEQTFLFKAHGEPTPGDTSKYNVVPGAQHLMLFYFAAPWSGEVQLLAARSRIDNARVVHHWGIYAVDNPDAFDGEILGSPDRFYAPAHTGAQGLFAAGPGGQDLELPPGVGLRVPTGENLTVALEFHYFNPSDVSETDASGIEICVTSKKREVEAAPHLLGRLTFSLPAKTSSDVVSTCRPMRQQTDVHLLSVTPHMHLTGTRSKLILNRQGGEQIALLDQPYTFQEQRTYNLPTDGSAADVVLKPGDTLTSTCTFDNTTDSTIMSSDRSEDEMCQQIVVAWPAGVLSNGWLPEDLFFVGPDAGCVEL
jgi:Copper type II ascorbate-dependent monooxygenase, C-terminal domain